MHEHVLFRLHKVLGIVCVRYVLPHRKAGSYARPEKPVPKICCTFGESWKTSNGVLREEKAVI